MDRRDLKNKKDKYAKPETKKGGFKIPKWMDCSWRRVPCGKKSCKICGTLKKNYGKRFFGTERAYSDFDDIFSSVSLTFKDILKTIKEDAAKKGIEITNIDKIKNPPEPRAFSIYKKAKRWSEGILGAVDVGYEEDEMWTYIETVDDLVWYSSLLPAKVYRQLCNRWHIKRDDGYGEFDYQYSKYVLKECLKILDISLSQLSPINISFINANFELAKLKKEILNI